MTNLSSPPSGPISAWSISRLDVFETCPYRAYLEYVKREEKPPLTVPPGKEEHPLERGSRIHKLAESYVTQDTELFPELESFRDDFVRARDTFRERPHNVNVEQQWAFTVDWKPTGWFSATAWGRLVLDLCIRDDTRMRVIDHKTGKKYGNKHVGQGQLYALVALLRYPDIQTVNTEFWYLDSGEKVEREYSRIQAMTFRDDFHLRGETMTTATDFPPRPSVYGCRFCPYAANDNGNAKCQYSYVYEE